MNFAIAPEPSMADNIMLVKDIVILKLVAEEAPSHAVLFMDDIFFLLRENLQRTTDQGMAFAINGDGCLGYHMLH